MNIMMGLQSDKLDLDDLQQTFMKLSKGGRIDKEGMKKAAKQCAWLQDTDWEQIFDELDQRQKGQINYQDFLTAAVDKRKLLTEENIDQTFNLFDHDKDGKIDIEDFKNTLPSQKMKPRPIEFDKKKLDLEATNILQQNKPLMQKRSSL